MKGEPVHSRALDGSACWQCGGKYRGAISLTRSEAMEAGSITVCAKCGAVSIVGEADGALLVRPPDILGVDSWLREDRVLFDLLITRTLYASGLLPRQCPQCGAVARPLTGCGTPRVGDTTRCKCGALLQIQGDLSFGLKEE